MRTFTSTITAMGWRPAEDLGDGLGSTTKNVPINRWATRRRPGGIGMRPSLAASLRTGNRCEHVLEATSHRQRRLDHELKSACWMSSEMSSEMELENGPPAAVKKGTQEKREGRAALVYATSFSLSKMIEARGNGEPTETGAASRNVSLKNAPSGSNIGVHLIEQVARTTAWTKHHRIVWMSNR